jgi:hypothetical protein
MGHETVVAWAEVAIGKVDVSGDFQLRAYSTSDCELERDDVCAAQAEDECLRQPLRAVDVNRIDVLV